MSISNFEFTTKDEDNFIKILNNELTEKLNHLNSKSFSRKEYINNILIIEKERIKRFEDYKKYKKYYLKNELDNDKLSQICKFNINTDYLYKQILELPVLKHKNIDENLSYIDKKKRNSKLLVHISKRFTIFSDNKYSDNDYKKKSFISAFNEKLPVFNYDDLLINVKSSNCSNNITSNITDNNISSSDICSDIDNESFNDISDTLSDNKDEEIINLLLLEVNDNTIFNMNRIADSKNILKIVEKNKKDRFMFNMLDSLDHNLHIKLNSNNFNIIKIDNKENKNYKNILDINDNTFNFKIKKHNLIINKIEPLFYNLKEDIINIIYKDDNYYCKNIKSNFGIFININPSLFKDKLVLDDYNLIMLNKYFGFNVVDYNELFKIEEIIFYDFYNKFNYQILFNLFCICYLFNKYFDKTSNSYDIDFEKEYNNIRKAIIFNNYTINEVNNILYDCINYLFPELLIKKCINIIEFKKNFNFYKLEYTNLYIKIDKNKLNKCQNNNNNNIFYTSILMLLKKGIKIKQLINNTYNINNYFQIMSFFNVKINYSYSINKMYIKYIDSNGKCFYNMLESNKLFNILNSNRNLSTFKEGFYFLNSKFNLLSNKIDDNYYILPKYSLIMLENFSFILANK